MYKNLIFKPISHFRFNLNNSKSFLNLRNFHTPVLCEQTIDFLEPGPNKTIIDMTFGGGGHTKAILQTFENVKVIALDRDPDSQVIANELAKEYPGQVIPLLGKFSDLPKLLKSSQNENIVVDGILFDFGCSSMQFDNGNRGFSISKDGPLDMRMNKKESDSLSAAEVINKIDEDDLYKIIKIYGEEKQARKIARSIVNYRSISKILTTRQLAEIIENSMNNAKRFDKIQRPSHSATKTFQALRIFVNNELNEINYGMLLAEKLLKPNGRLVTITFHSLEDIIVKRHIQGFAAKNESLSSTVPLKYSNHDIVSDDIIKQNNFEKKWHQLNKHVVTPNENEVISNPRSRSAKLRALTKSETS